MSCRGFAVCTGCWLLVCRFGAQVEETPTQLSFAPLLYFFFFPAFRRIVEANPFPTPGSLTLYAPACCTCDLDSWCLPSPTCEEPRQRQPRSHGAARTSAL
eukprot:GGOE01065145.1.p2 GENE.GGOE01065145.1~~GGOE01065145.1.p2  ORF type:complete len:101 (+),score=2.81 GGOE01065145.1:397-699(+)